MEGSDLKKIDSKDTEIKLQELSIPHMMSAITLIEIHLNTEQNKAVRANSKNKITVYNSALKSLVEMKKYAALANHHVKNQEISLYVDSIKKFYGYLSFIRPVIMPSSISTEIEKFH